MKKVLFSAVAATALLFSSCGSVATPVAGLFYTDVTYGKSVTSNNLGSKVGRGKASGILGLIATGDASIESAAKSAGIKKVSHVDAYANSILGIITSYEIVVYGE